MDDRPEVQSEKHKRILREMERKSHDTVKVFNPTKEDYVLVYDARQWAFPNKDKDTGYGEGCLDVPRYIGDHYCKHVIDKLINEESAVIVAKAKKEYKGGHWPEEEIKVALKTSNPALRKKYLKIVWKGVVKEFAVTDAPLKVAEPRKKDDRPLDEQLIEEIESEQAPLYVAKKDRGKTVKQDKKEEFVEAIK